MVSAFLQRVVYGGVVWWKMRQVHFLPIMLANQVNGILEDSHHAQAEQVHLDDAHVGTVFLVPLHDDPAGHRRGLQRHDGIQASPADHQAAGVLSQMPRQVLNGSIERKKFAHQWLCQVNARIAELPRGGVLFVVITPHRRKAR